MTGLEITVENFSRLSDLLREDYSDRLVDILDIRTES